MKSSIIKTGAMLAGFLLAACLSTHAEVKLPAIFSDGMVMQQQTNANCFRVAGDYDAIRAYHKEMNCVCFENTAMGLYFINDPDDYWIEVLPQK